MLKHVWGKTQSKKSSQYLGYIKHVAYARHIHPVKRINYAKKTQKGIGNRYCLIADPVGKSRFGQNHDNTLRPMR